MKGSCSPCEAVRRVVLRAMKKVDSVRNDQGRADSLPEKSQQGRFVRSARSARKNLLSFQIVALSARTPCLPVRTLLQPGRAAVWRAGQARTRAGLGTEGLVVRAVRAGRAQHVDDPGSLLLDIVRIGQQVFKTVHKCAQGVHLLLHVFHQKSARILHQKSARIPPGSPGGGSAASVSYFG